MIEFNAITMDATQVEILSIVMDMESFWSVLQTK